MPNWPLAELMRRIPEHARFPEGAPPGWAEAAGLALTGLTADSRAVKLGFLFAALPGSGADGRDFIAEAVARGASAVLAPPGTQWPAGVPPRPLLIALEPRRRLAQLAAALANAQPETVIAVTGTNGKTSTVDFLRQLWTLAGRRAAALGTLGVIAEGFPPGPGLTTPDPVRLHAILAELARAGFGLAAMEASSHGLEQCRLDGVRLAAGGFTNLTRDHLDYHATMAAYAGAKLRLFDELLPQGAPAVATTSLDQAIFTRLSEIAAMRHLDLLTVGEGGKAIDLIESRPVPAGQRLTLRASGKRREVPLALPGRFQADNALLAAALAETTGLTDALSLLPRLKGVRGRMERVLELAHGAAAYVDYAHTPDALSRLLAALRPHAAGRLIVVFGAGGDRDPGKRVPMGEAAANGADVVIVTNDNPRREDPGAIRRAVLRGAPAAREIEDRRAAIAAGLAELKAGDVLVVAGKGHEQGQIVGNEVIPFDDAAVLRELAGLG